MSADLLKILIPALLALLGTGLGLWLGQRRWASELKMSQRRAFDARRHSAYEELWQVVESAHIAIRTGRPSPQEVRELDSKMNAFRMQKAVVLDKADGELSNRYFNSVVALSKAIAESGSRELAERYETTASFAASDISHLKQLTQANEEVNVLREQLIDRVRAVMLQTSYAVPAR